MLGTIRDIGTFKFELGLGTIRDMGTFNFELGLDSWRKLQVWLLLTRSFQRHDNIYLLNFNWLLRFVKW